jgi:hypothetical protein
MATDYNLKYKEVHCLSVDWDKKEFDFLYKKHLFKYKQECEINASADTDHIRMAIDMFLKHVDNDAIINLIAHVNYMVESLEEAMGEDEEQQDYYEGQYRAYVDVLERLTTIGKT